MKQVGDVSRLIGRHFVSGRGNVARSYRLGAGGIGVAWCDDPTEQDATEYNEWALSILGANYAAHSEINRDSTEAKEAYRKWLAGR